jgi:hypothetical protein
MQPRQAGEGSGKLEMPEDGRLERQVGMGTGQDRQSRHSGERSDKLEMPDERLEMPDERLERQVGKGNWPGQAAKPVWRGIRKAANAT